MRKGRSIREVMIEAYNLGRRDPDLAIGWVRAWLHLRGNVSNKALRAVWHDVLETACKCLACAHEWHPGKIICYPKCPVCRCQSVSVYRSVHQGASPRTQAVKTPVKRGKSV